MRALLLTALLVPAAAAQGVRTLPTPDGASAPLRFDEDRCDAPRTMPTPFEAEPGAAAVEVELGGPAPVPMPNLCGPPSALAGNAAGPLDLRPGLDAEEFRNAPPAVRDRWRLPFDRPQWHAVPEIDPDVLRRYLDRLPEADAPVAPPGDRE